MTNRESFIELDKLKQLYLEIRASEDLTNFLLDHPEMETVTRELEEQIYSLAKYLHGLYMRIFIKNETTLKCTRDERKVLAIIHKLYITTKQRTVPSRVNDVLVNINPRLLNKLLNFYINKIASKTKDGRDSLEQTTKREIDQDDRVWCNQTKQESNSS